MRKNVHLLKNYRVFAKIETVFIFNPRQPWTGSSAYGFAYYFSHARLDFQKAKLLGAVCVCGNWRYFFQVQRAQNAVWVTVRGVSNVMPVDVVFSLTWVRARERLPRRSKNRRASLFLPCFICVHLVLCVCAREAEHIKKRQLGSHAPMQRASERLKVQAREREIRCGHNYWFSLVRPFELLMSIVLSVTWRPRASSSHRRIFCLPSQYLFASVFRTASVPEQISVRCRTCMRDATVKPKNFNCSLKSLSVWLYYVGPSSRCM